MRQGNVLGFLAAPSREDSLRAVSLAILRVRAKGITFKDIGKAIDVCADTVEGAANERSLLSFDAVARLGYFWPDEFAPVADLWFRPSIGLTLNDRLDDLVRNIETIRRLQGDNA